MLRFKFPIWTFFMAVRAVAEDFVCLEYDAAKVGTRNLTFRGKAVSSSKIII
jgi:hypothetical protein